MWERWKVRMYVDLVIRIFLSKLELKITFCATCYPASRLILNKLIIMNNVGGA